MPPSGPSDAPMPRGGRGSGTGSGRRAPRIPTYSASWNAGSRAPSHGYPRFQGKIMGTIRPQSAVSAGEEAQLGRPGEVEAVPEQGEGQPREDEKQVAERAEQQQDEQRRRPGEVPEFVRRVRHPMEADQAEDELGQPPAPEDLPDRLLPQPEQPQGYEAEKERPGRERNIAGSYEEAPRAGAARSWKGGSAFSTRYREPVLPSPAIGSRAGGAGKARTTGRVRFAELSWTSGR